MNLMRENSGASTLGPAAAGPTMTVGPAPWQRKAAGVVQSVEAGLSAVLAVILVLLLALVLVSVGLRYLWSTGFVGAEEAAVWLFTALVALGLPLGMSGPLSMRLDILLRVLPVRWVRVAGIVADAISVSAGLTLIVGGTGAAALVGSTSVALGLPDWLRPALLAGGGALLIAVLILRRAAEAHIGSVLLSAGLAACALLFVREAWVDISWPPSLIALLVAGIGLALGAPLAHCLLAGTFLVIPAGSSLPEAAIVSTAASGLSRFLLLAIPFFLLAGALLTSSGAAGNLVRLAASLVGHRRAGLGQTALLTSVLFSGASGSSIANAAFGATTFFPQLVRSGYRREQAGAIVAATSVLDNVVPPSIAFLILAAATDLSVGALLVGGIYAGLLMAFCLAVAIHIANRQMEPAPAATRRERGRAFVSAIPALGLVMVVVAGIRFGVVTTTEAAALAAGYALVLALLAGRCEGAGMRGVISAFRQSAAEAAAVGFLIAAAGPLTFLLAVDDVASLVTNAVTALGDNPIVVLLLCNLVLLAAGLVLDIGAAILLLGPILLPAVIAAGIDPVHFGVILVVNLMIGGLTPPVGILVFVVSGVTGVDATRLFRAVLPYLAALLAALFILCLAALIF